MMAGTTPMAGNPGQGGSAGTSNPDSGDGIALAGDLEIVDLPECDQRAALPCNGACVPRDEEINGCRFIASSTVFTDLEQDAAGSYLVTVSSRNANIVEIDVNGTGFNTLVSHPGGSLHLDLALDDGFFYYVVPGSPPSVWRSPRVGGAGTLVKAEVPRVGGFEVLGQYAFVAELFEPRLHRVALDSDEVTMFEGSVHHLKTDGQDLYFVRSAEGIADLYRAAGGDVQSAQLLVENVRGPILGFSSSWIYAVAFRQTDPSPQVYRFDKDSGAEEIIAPLGSVSEAALARDVVIFTHHDGSRKFVNTVDLNGENRTIVGYLPLIGPSVEFLTADSNFVYATKGFVMTRLRR